MSFRILFRVGAAFAAGALAAGGGLAQVKEPDSQKLIAELEDQVFAQRRILNDWGGLTYYGSENSEIRLEPGVARVVLLGDDVVEKWGPEFFPGKPYFNRGIARQTTGQMLVRFRQDVVGLKPKTVVIQGGMNDLAGYAGPATTGTIADNVMSMVDIARANGIQPVLASLTPVCDCKGHEWTARRPVGKILGVNEWLKEYAAREGLAYLDWYGALVEGRAFKAELTVDGLLPNQAGYAAMAGALDKALAAAGTVTEKPPRGR